MLHTSFFYKRIHKRHHKYIISEAIATLNTHPLEFIIENVVPYVIGPILLGKRCHLFTSFFFGVWNLVNATNDHSGYEFPWTVNFNLLPLTMASPEHDFHHKHNIGNYGLRYSFWDTICNTNKEYMSFSLSRNKND
jgi:sterol desaturase/sphingolipid hydroxylase (fatty acid hydroxylase superfamily)